MNLADLEAFFIRREKRPCLPGAREPDCFTVSEHTEHEYHVPVEALAQADGVQFLCPVCFAANKGTIGTHSIICWRPRVPPDVCPKPGRWEFVGTGLHDLTLVAGSSSIFLQTAKCGAHFFIRNGLID
jgi:hypothetical protein